MAQFAVSPSGPLLSFVALQRDVGNLGNSGLDADAVRETRLTPTGTTVAIEQISALESIEGVDRIDPHLS